MKEAQLLKRDDLIFPDLTYQIMGVLFEVFKELGYGYHEKHYYRAIKNGLVICGLEVREQVSVSLIFQGKTIGK
jgi:GxxExxY protein